MLTASPIAEGLLLNGTAPWFTGAGIFGGSVTAATLPSGDTIFVRHSLTTEGLELSEPFKLAAFEAAQTVSAKFDDCFIPETDVIGTESPDWIDSNDMLNISLQSPFALGCAAAGLDCVAENFESKGIKGIDSAHRSLLEELGRCRTEAFAAMDDRADNRRGLRARAWAISMAFRCAQAAIVSSSGAGNSMNHAAQRIYREALVFAVSAQTTDIMEATLAKISEESSSEA
jgi:alkylation response protein AidB-like acyl-CoA dehydrogenase